MGGAAGGLRDNTLWRVGGCEGEEISLGTILKKENVNTSIVAKMPFLSFLAINYNIPVIAEAVSYTHLDVYKRQSLIHSRAERAEEAEARERALNWLDFVGLRDHANDQAGALSYGQQRLLEIVRGLASNPKLILLDEPAAGMNSREKEELNALLRRILDKGVNILIVEHDMKLMMDVTDRLFVLNYGKKLAEGTPEEIQKMCIRDSRGTAHL